MLIIDRTCTSTNKMMAPGNGNNSEIRKKKGGSQGTEKSTIVSFVMLIYIVYADSNRDCVV